jgi:tetratricopeptide (TPR) repeat protein
MKDFASKDILFALKFGTIFYHYLNKKQKFLEVKFENNVFVPIFANIYNPYFKMTRSLKFFAGLVLSMVILNAKAQSVQEGLKALEYEQTTKAGGIFENLAKSQPTAENYYFLGYFYLKTDQTDKAKESFDKAVTAAAADAKSPWGSIAKGVYALYMNKQTEAKTEFDKAIQLTKAKKADVLFRIGEAYASFPEDESKRDVARAVEVLNMAAKIDANNPEIFATLGNAYILKNDGSNSGINYETAIRLNPKAAKSYVNYGNVLVRAKNNQESMNNYNKGLEVEPGYTPGYRRRADLYYRIADYPKAIADLRKYIELSENKNDAKWELSKSLYLLARNLQDDRKTAEANEAFKQTLSMLTELQSSNSNLDPVAYRMLAVSQYETKDFANGLKSIDNLFSKIDSKKILTTDYKYKAKLQAANGQDSLSILTLQKAMELDTADFDLYKQAGDSYVKLKKYDKGAEMYKTMVSKKSEKATGADYFLLGRTYYFAKNFTEADTVLSVAIIKYSNNPAGQMQSVLYKARSKSNADYQANKNDLKWTAVSTYQQYLSLVKEEDKAKYKENLIEAYNHLGGYEFFKNKNKTKALEYWNKTLELNPTNKEAQDYIKMANPPTQQPKTTQKTTPKPNGK